MQKLDYAENIMMVRGIWWNMVPWDGTESVWRIYQSEGGQGHWFYIVPTSPDSYSVSRTISNNVSFQIIFFKILSWRGTYELYEESVYKLASLSKCWETILCLAWKPHPDYVSYSRISCSNRLTQISWIILFLSLPNDSYQKP